MDSPALPHGHKQNPSLWCAQAMAGSDSPVLMALLLTLVGGASTALGRLLLLYVALSWLTPSSLPAQNGVPLIRHVVLLQAGFS